MLRCWWRTYVSWDVVKDGTELVKNAVALCKRSAVLQWDPGACQYTIR